ncbi:hypothetical protein T12_12775 [Trichinella patagoniensis]|uniref:Uncharacterized protein n=1 Tax=Trichinella patagoniensis TaxID=990121 RepID=A0A0V0Z3H1_9BILA|nr:hypothetical protein T12_2680 [Trichinella patagoniensis]KRY06942.1 hypothetical protein T12_12775 [Trichinella patagoniensis]
MLLYVHIRVGSVGNAYIGLTEEERQHEIALILGTTSRGPSPIRKMLCNSHQCEKPLLLTPYHSGVWLCYSEIMDNLSFTENLNVAGFLRSMTLQDMDVKLIAEGRLKNQKYGHLDMLCRTRWAEQQNAILTFFNLYWPLVESLQHTIAWKDRSTAFKAEQLLVSICRGIFVISLAVLNKVLSLTLLLPKILQASCFDLLQCCDKLNSGSGGLNLGTKTLYGDLIPPSRNIFKQMNRSNIRNKSTSTDGVDTFMQNLDFDQYDESIKKFYGYLLKIYRRLKLPISALDALALYPKSYYLNVSLPLQIFASATAERSYTA